ENGDFAQPPRSVENLSYRENPGQAVIGNRGHARGGDASAFRTHRTAAELAWVNAGSQVRGYALRDLGEDALARRGRRLQIAFQDHIGHVDFRKLFADGRQFAHNPLPVVLCEAFFRCVAFLRSIQAVPDFADLFPRRPEVREFAEIVRTV